MGRVNSQSTSNGVLRSVSGTAGAKVLTMACAGLLGITSSRIIIQTFGIDAYAQYGLLNGIRSLIPFVDLGVGAVVLNVVATSDDPRHSDQVLRALITSLRALVFSGAIVAAAAVMIGIAGWWPALLGQGLLDDGSITATTCFVVFGLSLPLGIGVRVLIGLRRNTLQALLQGLISPIFLLGLILLVLCGVDPHGNFVALISYLAASAASLMLLIVAARLIAPQVQRALYRVPRLISTRGTTVIGTAAPVLVQAIANPVALQSDRILLSHRASTIELAQYTFANQIFGLILQTIIAGGIALWPFFARARSQGEVLRVGRLSGGFLTASLAMGISLAFAMPVIERVAADGKVHLPNSILIAYILFVAVMALNYPPGMYMTDERGLRFQVLPILAMMSSNLLLSWILIPALGAAGPVLGSAAAILVFQVIPNTWWVRRDMRRRRVQLSRSDTASELSEH